MASHTRKKYVFFLVLLLLCVFSAVPVEARNDSMLQGIHGDRSIVLKGCRSCHRGMSMGLSGEEEPCLPCHSDASSRLDASRRGMLDSSYEAEGFDIFSELEKPYRHPVIETRGVHKQFESLPEELPNAARHSECVDCHNVHLVEEGKPFIGISGRRVGNFIADIQYEYELCYRCHTESANLPANSTDKHMEFKVSNPSYHPVEGEGKNTYVISLKEPYVAVKEEPDDVSIITCGDCHGSDDVNGPRGPHGSNFSGLLTLNYEMEDQRPESEYAYALCYKCHDRTSILNNESFPYHAQHIQGEVGGQEGTSCFTCHDAHGSTQHQYLIRFNEEVVSENEKGRLVYESQGYSARNGACYLNCHDIEHDPDVDGSPGKY